MKTYPVFVVRRKDTHDAGISYLHSAWPDVYSAKFEAQRWQEDSKVPHDFVRGTLTVEENASALVAHEEVATNVSF